jgi:hypothetical protein
MELSKQTITNLLRKTFCGSEGMRVASDQLQAIAADVAARLTGQTHIQFYEPSGKPDARFTCRFSIGSPPPYYPGTRSGFYLRLDDHGRLVIVFNFSEFPVSSIDEVCAFVVACKQSLDRARALLEKQRSPEGLERAHALMVKRDKVRHLKAQAIIAHVNKLARQEQFDFYTQLDAVKITLCVKLSDRKRIDLQIPFTRINEALPKLGAAIHSLREIQALGIKFKVSS